MDTKKDTQLFRIHDEGVEIINEELFNKIKKANLSANMVDSFLACPADWVLDKYLLNVMDHEEQPALERGTLFHAIMESFFRVPTGERSPQMLAEITKQEIMLNHPHYMSDDISKTWIKDTVMNYLRMGFDFNQERVPSFEERGKNKLALEMFVNGRVSDTKHPIVGFIDKLVYDKNGHLTMEDWKTGAKVHDYNPDKKISKSNPFGYWRQQTLYAMLLEDKGIKLDKASLVFPNASTVVNVDFNNPNVRQQVIDDMNTADNILEECINNNLFPFTPAQYCKWCRLFYNGKMTGRAYYPAINQYDLPEFIDDVRTAGHIYK